MARCSYRLLDSGIFAAHKDYVRRQCVYALLQEDDASSLHLIAAILLYDGRTNEETFITLQQEGAFPRLVELISEYDGKEGEEPLHRMLLDIMYEMSRIQRLTWEDLCTCTFGPDATSRLLTVVLKHSDSARQFHRRTLRHHRVPLLRRLRSLPLPHNTGAPRPERAIHGIVRLRLA